MYMSKASGWRLSLRAGSGHIGAVLRQCKIGDETEMIAGPDPIDCFVERKLAGRDAESRPAVPSTAHEDMVDPLKGPVPIRLRHQRIACRERVPCFAGMPAVPRAPVAHAHPAKRLLAS